MTIIIIIIIIKFFILTALSLLYYNFSLEFLILEYFSNIGDLTDKISPLLFQLSQSYFPSAKPVSLGKFIQSVSEASWADKRPFNHVQMLLAIIAYEIIKVVDPRKLDLRQK